MPGHIVNVDLIPFPEICLGDIQYHLLVCDEFSWKCFSSCRADRFRKQYVRLPIDDELLTISDDVP